VLGLGRGWQVNEHEAYGIGLPAVGERLARLDEACQVIRSCTAKSAATRGRFYRPSMPLVSQAGPATAPAAHRRRGEEDDDANRCPLPERVELLGPPGPDGAQS